MAVIKQVIRCVNKGDYAVVYVRMDDGLEAQVYVGGDCETWIQGQVIKAHVKRAQSRKHA